MTVKELIEQLQKYDDDKTVLSFCGAIQENVAIVSVHEEEEDGEQVVVIF